MAHLEDLKATFKSCRGPFPWRNFQKLLTAMGYERLKSGKTGGSRRKFWNPSTGHIVMLDEPHDGEMRPGMVRRLQTELEDRGLI
jgi:hypothetical protein